MATSICLSLLVLLLISSGTQCFMLTFPSTTRKVCISQESRNNINEEEEQQDHLSSSSSSSYDNLWLLDGIDPSTADYFNQEMTINEKNNSFDLLNQPNFVWNAATEDAKARNLTTKDYIAKIEDAMIQYQMSSKVHDRQEFYSFLEQMDKQNGKLLLVLGGKSVGKSLVLRTYVNQLKLKARVKLQDLNKKSRPVLNAIRSLLAGRWIWRAVTKVFVRGKKRKRRRRKKIIKKKKPILALLANARSDPGFPLSFFIKREYEHLFDINMLGLKISRRDILKSVAKAVQRSVEQLAFPVGGLRLILGESTAGRIVELLGGRDVSSEAALYSFVRFSEAGGFFPVLVVDEANKVLGLGAGSNATSSILSTIVKFTKEEKRMSVVLASTDYNYPFLLEKLGLDPNDISKKLYAGEISPKSMWQLLVEEKDEYYDEDDDEDEDDHKLIGMGPNLAKVLMSAYGGHLFRIQEAVSDLASEGEDFFLGSQLNGITNQIGNCLGDNQGSSLLHQMATSGFAPVEDYNDNAVKMIIRENVGGLVSKERSTHLGFPKSNWFNNTESSFGLIPTSQSARLVIAKKLVEEETKKRQQAGNDK